ncbi:MAG: response regulator [Acidobacteriia bacterium]|nr:response regulator [Terriglobia bacterium]
MSSRILLADDSPTIREIARQSFEHERVILTCVNNGEAALMELEKEPPDLVLADIFMPGKTGFEVCEFIKQQKRLSSVPVILLVGAFEPFDEREATRVGADGHLKKPFTSKMLLEVVHKFIPGMGTPKEQVVSTVAVEGTQERPEEVAPNQDYQSALEAKAEAESPLETEYLLESSESTSGVERQSTASAVPDEPVLSHPEFNPQPGAILPEPPVIQEIVSFGQPQSTPSPGSAGGVEARSEAEYPEYAPSAEELKEPSDSQQLVDSAEGHSMPITEEFADFRRNLAAEAGKDVKGQVPLPSESQASNGNADSLRGPATMEEVLGGKVPAIDADETSVQADTRPAGSASMELTDEAMEAIVRRVVERMSTRVVEDIAWEVVPQIAEVLVRKKITQEN